MLQGWRSKDKDELVERILSNSVPFMPRNEEDVKVFRAGYLNALYLLRSEILPRAYIRSKETEELQAAIRMACARLQDTPVPF